MPDYGFYRDVYAGTSLRETVFPELIQRAADWLQGLERRCRVVLYGPDSREMALCAAAETLYRYRQTEFSQATVGGVSVRYEKSRESLQRQLLQAVSGYLDVYRGVS